MVKHFDSMCADALINIKDFPTEMQDKFSREMNLIKSLNISTIEDYRDFFYITIHIKQMAKQIIGRKPSPEEVSKLSYAVYSNKEKYPINNVDSFYKAVENAVNKTEIPIKKIAYPQGSGASVIRSPNNINKWLEATQNIYTLHARGKSLSESFKEITKEWDNMEKLDFEQWLSFYQSGADKAYKLASSYYDVNNAGAFIPLNWDGKKQDPSLLKVQIPNIPSRIVAPEGMEDLESKKPSQSEEEEVKVLIHKILGRLNSAEKLILRAPAAKLLGKNLESWITALQSIKRTIMLALQQNVSRADLETFHDLLIKKSNQIMYLPYVQGLVDAKVAKLNALGLVKTAEAVIKMAQGVPPGEDTTPQMPDPAAQIAPDMGLPPQEGAGVGKDDDADEAMKEFINNLKGDEQENMSDESDVSDISDADVEIDDGLAKTAQEAPVEGLPPAPDGTETVAPTPEAAPAQGAPTPTTEEKPVAVDIGDSLIEKALANVTVKDIISKLEELAGIFKNREISRQLAVIDLMMDAVGIAAFFPNLAEATNKSLESNQYTLTRVEDILAKLRGSEALPEKIKLAPEQGAETPVQQHLSDAEQQEKEKKLQRKKLQEASDAEASKEPAPEAAPAAPKPEVNPELAQPATVETPPPGIKV